MRVKEMILWLESLDPELDVYLEGLEQSSNLNPSTNRFEIYHEERLFNPSHYSYVNPNKKSLVIGLDV